VASHSRLTEELLLTQKYLSDVAGTSGKDQAQHPRHGSLGGLSSVNLGAIRPY